MSAEIIPLFAMHEGESVAPLRPWQTHTPKFVHHSQTSEDAAISILPKAKNLRQRVFELIVAHPEGLTDELIALKLDLNPSTARPRRIELAEKGVIESRGTAVTTSGRRAALWFTTESA